MPNTDNAPAANDLATLFDSLKPGQTIKISFTSCMARSNTDGIEFRVGRRSHSRKYNVSTIGLHPAGTKGKAQFKLYKRTTGVSMAHGNMGVQIHSITAE